MRCIALLSLICLVGAASAQAMFTGEGYGSGQLSFFNGPSTIPFEPFVEKYWNSYIHNAPNMTGRTSNPATTMNIWFNAFPLGFNEPLELSESSFNMGSFLASKYSPTELNSMQLKRNTLGNFNIDQSWKYTPVYAPASAQKSSFSLGKNESTSANEARSSGQILSQGIKALFSY
jgi:hypothetical protein